MSTRTSVSGYIQAFFANFYLLGAVCEFLSRFIGCNYDGNLFRQITCLFTFKPANSMLRYDLGQQVLRLVQQ